MSKTIKIACGREGDEPYQAEVDAEVFGAWAAHPAFGGIGFKVTFLRFGLATPFYFESIEGASSAAKEIDSLRSGWEAVTMAGIKDMALEIVDACKRNGGERIDYPTFKGEPAPVASLRQRDTTADAPA